MRYNAKLLRGFLMVAEHVQSVPKRSPYFSLLLQGWDRSSVRGRLLLLLLLLLVVVGGGGDWWSSLSSKRMRVIFKVLAEPPKARSQAYRHLSVPSDGGSPVQDPLLTTGRAVFLLLVLISFAIITPTTTIIIIIIIIVIIVIIVVLLAHHLQQSSREARGQR